jgi:hypothetical protein
MLVSCCPHNKAYTRGMRTASDTTLIQRTTDGTDYKYNRYNSEDNGQDRL